MGFYEVHARHYGLTKGASRARVGRLRTVQELPKVLTLAQIVAQGDAWRGESALPRAVH
ncbi:MAG: hypothetical protein ACYC91_01155 [Solirubrobacteraceae bacterium]